MTPVCYYDIIHDYFSHGPTVKQGGVGKESNFVRRKFKEGDLSKLEGFCCKKDRLPPGIIWVYSSKGVQFMCIQSVLD